MSAGDVVHLALAGVAMGCVYGLVALGFLMIYLSANALNFAHGELVMVGGYLAIGTYLATGGSLAAAVAVGVAGTAVVGVILQALAYAPLRRQPMIVVIVSTIAVGVVLRNVALNVAGPDPLTLPPFFARDMIALGSLRLPSQLVAIVAVTATVLGVQYVFFTRTRLGKMMQATAQDQEAARLMGIPVGRMITLMFMLSAGLAACAAVMVAPLFFISPDMGGPIVIKAWVGIVVGGFGSIPGAVVGGVIIGVLETFTAAFLTSDFKDVLTLVILIAFLVWRPQGVFGERIGERI